MDKLPGYEPKTASNPFYTFQLIPYSARHSFMLDEAQTRIISWVNMGPVRGFIEVFTTDGLKKAHPELNYKSRFAGGAAVKMRRH